MKKILIAASLVFLTLQLHAQSQLCMGRKWSRANLDTIIQQVNLALGTGYGITDESVNWMLQSRLPYYDVKVSLEKGWGIDRTVRKADFPHIDVEIQAFVNSNSDTLISFCSIVARWSDIIKIYSTVYKSNESTDSIYMKNKAKLLYLPTANKWIDEVIKLEQLDPTYHTWSLLSTFVQASWTAEMTSIYGSKREKEVEDFAGKRTVNPYLRFIPSFKVIFGEDLGLFLADQMKCTLLKKTTTPTEEILEFATSDPSQDPKNIVITFNINADKRVISAKMTGSIKAMTEFYKGFWPVDSDPGSASVGVVGVKTILGDIVTLKKSGATGYITITKKPGFDYSKIMVSKD
jgi:hypothetical protein